MPRLDPFHDASGRGPGPTILGAFVCLLALVAVGSRAEHIPELRRAPEYGVSDLVWTGPGEAPMYVHGEWERARLVVLGNSRVSTAIVLGELEREWDAAAFGWTGGANLETLLRAADRIEGVPLVIAIAPTDLGEYDNEVVRELMREKSIVFDPDASPRAVAAWSEGEVERLAALGNERDYVRAVIAEIAEAHDAAFVRRHDPLTFVDRRLTVTADAWRCALVPTISSVSWRWRWFRNVDTTRTLRNYDRRLLPEQIDGLRAAADRCAATIAALAAGGRKIACIRLPLAQATRELEDARLGFPLLESLAAKAGVPYRDFGAAYSTFDGSHLDWAGAKRLTRDLSRWLREDLGWTAER